eukprot:scaffold1893_cov166-Skeletonema_dohrnii-CCMP3373.AAC.1
MDLPSFIFRNNTPVFEIICGRCSSNPSIDSSFTSTSSSLRDELVEDVCCHEFVVISPTAPPLPSDDCLR